MLFVNFICLFYLMVLINGHTISKSIANTKKLDESVFDSINEPDYATEYKAKYDRRHTEHRGTESRKVVDAVEEKKKKEEDTSSLYFDDDGAEIKPNIQNSHTTKKKPSFWKKIKHFMKKDKKTKGNNAGGVPLKEYNRGENKNNYPNLKWMYSREDNNNNRKEKTKQRKSRRRRYENNNLEGSNKHNFNSEERGYSKIKRFPVKRKRSFTSKEIDIRPYLDWLNVTSMSNTRLEQPSSRPTTFVSKQRAFNKTKFTTRHNLQIYSNDRNVGFKGTLKTTSRPKTTDVSVASINNYTDTITNLSKIISVMSTKVAELKKMYNIDKTLCMNTTSSSFTTTMRRTTPPIDTKYDKDWPSEIVSTPKTTDDGIFRGTAQIESLLEEIKMKALHTISDQDPALTDLITNTVTETTFEHDPLLNHVEVVTESYPKVMRDPTVTESNFFNYSQSYSPIVLFNNAVLKKRSLDSENRNSYSLEKKKISSKTEENNKIKCKCHKLDFKKVINKFGSKMRAGIEKTKTTIKKIAAKIKSTTKRPKSKTCKTTPECDYIKSKEKRAKNRATTSKVGKTTVTEDDFHMLTLYEDMLKKAHRKSALKLITSSDTPLMFQWGKDRLSKRNSAILSNLIVKENEKLYDYGIPDESLDYVDDSLTTAKDKAEKGVTSTDTSYTTLSDKLLFNDYVNGYRNYLNFQKEQGHQNFSNLVRYQAHKHHDVNDIGRFILNKLPQIPDRYKRKFNDESDPMEDQDVSTKSDDSWFKKHFYFFIDNGPPKKYHTSQNMTLKAPTAQLSTNVDTATEKLKSKEGLSRYEKKNLFTKRKFGTSRNKYERFTTRSQRFSPIQESQKTKQITRKDADTDAIEKALYKLRWKRLSKDEKKSRRSIDTKNVEKETKQYKKSTQPPILYTQPAKLNKDIFKLNKELATTEKNTMRQNKIKKLLNKFSLQMRHRKVSKKNYTNKPKREIPIRLPRYNPLQKLKYIFKAKEAANDVADYDILNKRINTFKAVRYDKLPSLDDMRSSIPNIVTETTTVDPEMGKLLQEAGGDNNLNYPSDEYSTTEDASFMIMSPSSDPSGSHRATTSTEDIYGRELEILNIERTTKPHKNLEDINLENIAKFETGNTKTKMEDINTKKTKDVEADTSQDEYDSFTTTMNQIRNEIDKVEMRINWLEKSTMAPHLNTVIRSAKKNVYVFPSAMNLNVRDQKKSTVKIELILPTSYSPNSNSKLYIYGLKNNFTLPKTSNNDDDSNDNSLYFYVNNTSPHVAIISNKDRNNINKDRHNRSVSKLFQATISADNITDEAVTEVSDPTKIHDYFNDLVIWNSDVLDSDNINQANPTWMSIMKMLKSYPDYTTHNVKSLEKELTQIRSWLNDIVDKQDEFEANNTVKVLTATTSSKNKVDKIGANSRNFKTTKSHETKSKSVNIKTNYNIKETSHRSNPKKRDTNNGKLNDFEPSQYKALYKQHRRDVNNTPYNGETSNEGPDILLRSTFPTYDDSMVLLANKLPSKKIAKNSLRTIFQKSKTSVKSTVPSTKTNTPPVQYFTTPLPMPSNEFEKFLKEHDLDVDSVTSPIMHVVPQDTNEFQTRKEQVKNSYNHATKLYSDIDTPKKFATKSTANLMSNKKETLKVLLPVKYDTQIEKSLSDGYKNITEKQTKETDNNNDQFVFEMTQRNRFNKNIQSTLKYLKSNLDLFGKKHKEATKPQVKQKDRTFVPLNDIDDLDVTIISLDDTDKENGSTDYTYATDYTTDGPVQENNLVQNNNKYTDITTENLKNIYSETQNHKKMGNGMYNALMNDLIKNKARPNSGFKNIPNFSDIKYNLMKNNNNNNVLNKGEPKRIVIATELTKYDILYDDHMKSITQYSTSKKLGRPFGLGHNLNRNHQFDEEREIINMVEIFEAVENFTRPNVMLHIDLPTYFEPCPNAPATIPVPSVTKSIWNDYIMKYLSGIALLEMLSKFGIIKAVGTELNVTDTVGSDKDANANGVFSNGAEGEIELRIGGDRKRRDSKRHGRTAVADDSMKDYYLEDDQIGRGALVYDAKKPNKETLKRRLKKFNFLPFFEIRKGNSTNSDDNDEINDDQQSSHEDAVTTIIKVSMVPTQPISVMKVNNSDSFLNKKRKSRKQKKMELFSDDTLNHIDDVTTANPHFKEEFPRRTSLQRGHSRHNKHKHIHHTATKRLRTSTAPLNLMAVTSTNLTSTTDNHRTMFSEEGITLSTKLEKHTKKTMKSKHHEKQSKNDDADVYYEGGEELIQEVYFEPFINNIIINKSDTKDIQGHNTLVLTTTKPNSKEHSNPGRKAASRESEIYYEPHLKFKSTLKPQKTKSKQHKTKSTTVKSLNAKNKSLVETKLYEIKLEKRDAHENTFTAKNVAALEVVVDLMKNLDTDVNELRFPLSNGIKSSHTVPFNPSTIATSSNTLFDGGSLNQTANSIQVHIAIPYSSYDKKRSVVPLRVRKVFTAKLLTPVDLEYQIHSVEDNDAGFTTKMQQSSPRLTTASNWSPGLYLLIGYPNTSLFNESLSVQPLPNLDFNEVNVKNSISNVTLTTPKVLVTNMEKNVSKVTLSKEFISALNEQILSIYENLTLKPEDHENMVRKVTSKPTKLAKLRSKRHINWDAVKQYFGHERACSCRCVPNKPMCRVCAASDAVMSELIFELDNLAKYMNDHCTEIQTFFWMNPSEGRKLRESVRRIDRTLNDYFKRVKGKCQGRTCKMLSMPVDKRELVKVGKNETMMPLIDDLVALARDLETARNFNVSFSKNIKDAGENLIHTVTNCVPVVSDDNHILSPRQNNRTIYSLDNISVNIICNPEIPTSEAYDTSLGYLFADIQSDKNYPFLNNNNVDELTRNKKKSKSFKNIFTRDKKKKKDKNLAPQLNLSKSSLTKRELSKSERRSEFQIESPLRIDCDSSLRHDHLNKGSTQIIRDVRNIKNIKKLIMRNLMGDTKSNDVENTTSTHIEQTEPSANNEKYLNEITTESDILNDDINEFLNSFTYTKVYYDTTPSEPVRTTTQKLHTKMNTIKSKQASRKTSCSILPAPQISKKTTSNKLAHKTHRTFTETSKYKTSVASPKITSVVMNKLLSNPPNKVPSTTILNKVTSTTSLVSKNSQTTFSLSSNKAKSTPKKTKFLDRLKAGAGDFLERLDNSVHINEVSDTTTVKPEKLNKTTRTDIKNTRKNVTRFNYIRTHLPFKSLNSNADFVDEKYVHKKSATKNISSTSQIKPTETPTNDAIEINEDANPNSLLLSILRYEANVLGEKKHKISKQEMMIQCMKHSDDQNGLKAEIPIQLPHPDSNNLPTDFGITQQFFTSDDFLKWVTKIPQTTSKHSTSSEHITKAHYLYYDMWKSLHDMDGPVISDKDDKVKNRKPEKGLMTTLKNSFAFGTNNTKKKTEKVDKEKHLRDLRDIPKRVNLFVSPMQRNERSYAKILRSESTFADDSSFPIKTALKMETLINEPNHIIEPSENVTNKSEVLKIAPPKTNKEERSHLEAYDPHPDSRLLCDLRATIDHIRDKHRSVSPRDFEQYVRNLKCYKYRNPPEYFYIEPCEKTLKSRNMEYNNIFKLKIPTKTSNSNELKWCGTRDKRFLLDANKLKNIEDISNYDFNDERDNNYDEVADDDDGEQFDETGSRVRNEFNSVNFVIGDDEIYFDTFVKGKDGVYRENRKKKSKRDTDLSELFDGLKNLPQLQPPMDEIYAMRGDSVKLHCFPSVSSPNDPMQFEGLLDLTRYKWKTDREDMLNHDNVAIEGPTIYIKKVAGINIGNYSCSKDNVVRRNVHLTVTSLPKFEVVFAPRYKCEPGCNYEDLKALQCLENVITGEVYSSNYQSTVRVDEPVCLRDQDDNSPQVRATVVMGNVRHPRFKCSVQCRRDFECSLALIVAANAPALSSVKVLLASKEGNKTLTPSLNVGRRFAVTHTLRRKDSNHHREYHKLAARMVPGSVSVVVSCPAGFYLIREHKICAPCPVDTYSTPGSNTCSPCAGGTHSPPAAPRCRRAPPVLRTRRYEWWCYPPCGWCVAGWGVVGGVACVALALCGAVRAALRRRCVAPHPAPPPLRPTLKRNNGDRTKPQFPTRRCSSSVTYSAQTQPRRALSPSRVILARFFRSPPPSSRATDSQETKFELWKEKNIPPPLPPIDFDA